MRVEKPKPRRQPLSRQAWIDPGDRTPVTECVIENMSDTGAKLVFTARKETPDHFVLRSRWTEESLANAEWLGSQAMKSALSSSPAL